MQFLVRETIYGKNFSSRLRYFWFFDRFLLLREQVPFIRELDFDFSEGTNSLCEKIWR